MEKLVKLLNEYEKDKYGISGSYELEIDDETGEPTGGIIDSSEDYFEVTSYYITMKIISKRFGFIKRLVENDKIDLKKLDEAERKPMYVTDDMFSLYKVDECVIMLCSIQDNSISFLISILK